jgi:hypothetical protein
LVNIAEISRGEGGGDRYPAKCVRVTMRGDGMVTWVLAEEPTYEVARAIEIVEYRLGEDPDMVQWICADLPVNESAQD